MQRLLLLISLISVNAFSQSPYPPMSGNYSPASQSEAENKVPPDLCTAEGLSKRRNEIGENDYNLRMKIIMDRFNAEVKARGRPPKVYESYGTPMTPAKAFDPDSALDAQIALAQALEKVPATVMSERFKLYLATHYLDIAMALTNTTYESPVNVPWPANDPKGVLKQKGAGDVRKILASLPAETKAAMTAAFAIDQTPTAQMLQQSSAAADTSYSYTNQPDPDRIPNSELLGLTNEARARVISAIAKGVDPNHYSATQRNMIARLKAIQIEAKPSMCGEFDIENQTISGCVTKPYSRVQVISKLVGRMISLVDDCALETPLYAVNETQLKKIQPQPFKSSADNYAFQTCLVAPKLKSYVSSSCLNEASPSALQMLIDKKVLVEAAPAIRHDALLEVETRECLAIHGGVKQVTEHDIDIYAERLTRMRQSQFGAVYSRKQDRAAIKKAFESRPACFFTELQDQMSDAFKMVLAQRSLTDLFRDAAKTSSKDDTVRALDYLDIHSEPLKSSMETVNSESSIAIINAAAADLQTADKKRMVSNVALKEIIFANSDVRQTLGCKAAASSSRKCSFSSKASLKATGSIK